LEETYKQSYLLRLDRLGQGSPAHQLTQRMLAALLCTLKADG
jgi:hypothetical protein